MAFGAMSTLPVFAETNTTLPVTSSDDGTVSVPITKVLTVKDGPGVLPGDDVKFNFTVSPDSEGTAYDRGATPDTVFKGPVGNDEITVTPAKRTGSTSVTYEGTLNIDPSKFPGPGIFAYTLEDDVTYANPVSGTTVDPLYEGFKDYSEYYTVKVAIEMKDGKQALQGVVATPWHKTDKVGVMSFAAEYDPKILLVEKQLSGNQAVPTDQFTFKLDVTGPAGETYRWAVYSELDENWTFNNYQPEQTGTVTANDAATGIIMQEGWHLVVFGLSPSDTYTLTETDTKGYEPSGAWQGKPEHIDSQADRQHINFLNKKEGTVPTGIIMTWAPYVLVAGLAVVFGVLFFGRRRHND